MDMDMDNFTCHSGSFNTSSQLDCDGSYGDEVVFFCCGLSTSLLPDSSLSYSLSPLHMWTCLRSAKEKYECCQMSLTHTHVHQSEM